MNLQDFNLPVAISYLLLVSASLLVIFILSAKLTKRDSSKAKPIKKSIAITYFAFGLGILIFLGVLYFRI